MSKENITEGTEKGWSAKEWLPIGISVLSLLVSAATGYLANLRQVDDIRVIASPYPDFYLKGKTLVSTGVQRLTFINSGTRNAVITGISLMIINFGNTNLVGAENECNTKGRFYRSQKYNFEGLVLKPGDISAIQLQVADGEWRKRKTAGDEFTDDLGTDPVFEGGDTISTCLEIALTTPDVYIPDVKIPKYQEKLIDLSNSFGGDNLKGLSPNNKPVELYSKWGISLPF